MSKKEIAFIILGSLLVFGIVAGGAVYWFALRNTETTVRQTDEITAASSTSADGSALSMSSSGGGSELGQLMDTQGNQQFTGTDAGSSKATIPGPESFKQYEQYATSESPLFAELQKGTGTEVKAGMRVAIYYKGYLTDGTLFDQSKAGEGDKLQPLLFTVGGKQVIPGLEQDIVGMKVGGTRRMIIPPKLAYGEAGNEAVPPNSVLVFDIQLVDAL